ncbi:MAG: hypothetical protein WBP45_12700 [Daejeonella sp.]
MMYKDVTIYTPISNTSSAYFGKISRSIKELEKLSGYAKVKVGDQEISSIEIKYLFHRDLTIKKLFPPKAYKFFPKRKIFNKHFIRFKSRLTISNLEDFEKKQDFYIDFEYEVASFVRVLIIYMNLAKPGIFKTGDGKVIIKEKTDRIEKRTEKFRPIFSLIGESLELREELMWPPISELPFKVVFDFIQNHWAGIQNIPNNRVERAINTFSYIFHDNSLDNSASDLFYSVLGIEALFVSGHDNIQKQVDKKTQLLFGERKNFKKRFSQLYDFRSRYIHGQLDIVNRFFLNGSDDQIYSKHMVPLYDNTLFAILIFVASIQKHIELKKTELEFEYKLKE